MGSSQSTQLCGHSQSTVSSSGPHNPRKMWTGQRRSKGRTLRWTNGWRTNGGTLTWTNPCPMRNEWARPLLSEEEKAQGDLSTMFQYLKSFTETTSLSGKFSRCDWTGFKIISSCTPCPPKVGTQELSRTIPIWADLLFYDSIYSNPDEITNC